MNPWLARHVVYPAALVARGEPVLRILRELETSQWWEPSRLREQQDASLGELLRHAATRSEYYRRVAESAGLDAPRLTAADLSRFPVLTKDDLVDHRDALQVRMPPGTTSWKTTGGSTGVAVRLRKNRGATAAEQAASWRSYGWFGVRPGDRQARFWGSPLNASARLRYRAIDWVLNRERFSAFAFSAPDLRLYHARIRRDRPPWVYGYVSMLVQFASFCLEEGLRLDDLGVRVVVTTSEVLTAPDRALLEQAFGAPVCNEYGCGEVGPIFYECEKGSLHLMAENLLVELEPDPTSDRPDACRLLVTDLHNKATPLIRYDVGDRVVPAPPCACGRGLPAFAEIFGRAYDFVTAADGTRYHGEFFMYVLESARNQNMPIRQAQFVQTSPEEILVRLVPASAYRDSDGEALAEKLRRNSGGRFRVSVKTVPELPRERSGKIRLIRADATNH